MTRRYIALIGMPGCGKSTLARLLGARTGLPHVDLDDEIVRMAGQSIPDLFAQGEDRFRDWEMRALSSVEQKRLILATGGGIVKREENIQMLRQRGILVYIDRPVELIAQTIDMRGRPLLAGGIDRLHALHEERAPVYSRIADVICINDGTIESAVERIVAGLEKHESDE